MIYTLYREIFHRFMTGLNRIGDSTDDPALTYRVEQVGLQYDQPLIGSIGVVLQVEVRLSNLIPEPPPPTLHPKFARVSIPVIHYPLHLPLDVFGGNGHHKERWSVFMNAHAAAISSLVAVSRSHPNLRDRTLVSRWERLSAAISMATDSEVFGLTIIGHEPLEDEEGNTIIHYWVSPFKQHYIGWVYPTQPGTTEESYTKASPKIVPFTGWVYSEGVPLSKIAEGQTNAFARGLVERIAPLFVSRRARSHGENVEE